MYTNTNIYVSYLFNPIQPRSINSTNHLPPENYKNRSTKITISSNRKRLVIVLLILPARPRRQHTRQMVDLHARSPLNLSHVLQHLRSDIVELVCSILVLVVAHGKMYFLVKTVAMVILIVFGDRVLYLYTECHAGLIGPATRHVLNGVPAPAHHNSR